MKVLNCLIVSIILLLIMLPSLHAGETRIQTLGYEANYYVRDDNNVWYFPSTLPNYRSMVIAESTYPYESYTRP